MKKRIDFILFIVLTAASLQAQPYENAAGIRAGYSSGLNFKHITDDNLVIEGDGLYNRHGFQFTGVLAYQFSPYDKKRLYYYVGGGVFGGNWIEDVFVGAKEASVGAALVVGSEYVFREIPLTIGLEWKPMVSIFKTFHYAIPDIGLTVRFVIN